MPVLIVRATTAIITLRIPIPNKIQSNNPIINFSPSTIVFAGAPVLENLDYYEVELSRNIEGYELLPQQRCRYTFQQFCENLRSTLEGQLRWPKPQEATQHNRQSKKFLAHFKLSEELVKVSILSY
jgi:hypothetical protein